MPDTSRSHGLWAKTAPPAPDCPALRESVVTEVAVIGAGYTGLSAALHLAERGVAVTVLEASEIGSGGAGRNVGLVNAGMWVMPEALIARLGDDYGGRLLDCLGAGPALVWDIIARHGIECEAHAVGTLHAGCGQAGLAELTERARQWQARGAPVHLLHRAETAAMLGTSHYAGALFDRRAGTIQPLAYARGLARAAQAAGAVIHCQSPALGLVPAPGGWRIQTPGGEIRARQVLLAGDAYSLGPHREIALQQVNLPYFNMATPPLPAGLAAQIVPGRQGVWDTKEVLSSFRFDAANRLVFGSVGALRSGGMAVHSAWARRALSRIFPALGRVEFESAWYGQIGMTSDNLPRFHQLADGVYSLCGYNGRGIAPGTVFGRLAAGLLVGDISAADLPLPLRAPEPARLRALRSAWYEAGAQVVHLVADRL